MPFYTEDKEVTTSHLMQAAKRIMSARTPDSAQVAQTVLGLAAAVEKWETEPKPEAVKREAKS